MASLIKIKRSATPGKRPTLEQIALGELALNTYDGYLFTERDTGGVGIGTTVALLTPWTENYGAGSIYYQNNVGIGSSIPSSTLDVDGTLNVSGISTFTNNVIIDSSGYIQIPVGNSSQRPAGIEVALGQIRYNSELSTFEGYGAGNAWGSLGGVKDVDGDTYVKPESSAGSDEDALTFFTGGTERAVIDSDGNVGIGTTNPTADLDVVGQTELDNLNVSGVSTFTGTADFNGDLDVDGHTELDDVNVSGAITATTFTGDLSGNAGTATSLGIARNFSVTGDFVTAPAVSFDGTGAVALAATITADSITLGTYTSGDYVESVSGTANEIEVTGGTGEGSTPTIGFVANPTIGGNVNIGQDLTVVRDLQVTRNLNVNGTVTIGGTSATIFAETLKVSDPDLILGIRTDAGGNDISNDTTANHGGIAIASTEGSPLVTLVNPGAGETLPSTYKKIMWFKSNSFTGLNTDAWLSNYAIGIGSTQVPDGVRLAAGGVQITENDISVVRDINASGIATLPTIDATNATIDNLTFTNGTAITSVDTDLTAVSSSDDTLASAKAIKTYVDAQVTAQDLDFAGDTGTGAVDLDTQSFSIFGTTNEIETVGSGQSITIGLPNVVAITTSLTVGDATGITGGAPADQGVLSVYTSGGKNALIIQTDDNTQSRGLAFRNSGDKYAAYISAEDKGSNKVDLTFGVAANTSAIYEDVDIVDERVRITSDGDVGINTTLPTEKLDVIGTVKATDFDSTSDENLKTNIHTIENPLEKIVQIRGVNFDWKENGRPSAGVIAQEVEKVFPELVTNNGTKTVKYNGLIGLLIEVVKAQQEEIDILKSKIK